MTCISSVFYPLGFSVVGVGGFGLEGKRGGVDIFVCRAVSFLGF